MDTYKAIVMGLGALTVAGGLAYGAYRYGARDWPFSKQREGSGALYEITKGDDGKKDIKVLKVLGTRGNDQGDLVILKGTRKSRDGSTDEQVDVGVFGRKLTDAERAETLNATGAAVKDDRDVDGYGMTRDNSVMLLGERK
jgi:hypothetical protein